jgi:hypothetical protein
MTRHRQVSGPGYRLDHHPETCPVSRPAMVTADGSRSTSTATARSAHQPATTPVGPSRWHEQSGASPSFPRTLKESAHDRNHHRGRVEIDLGHLAPHPRNVRRSLGDLKDLTRSIRDRQSRPRWSCCQADDNGVHHIVAGHRHRAAAETAGLLAPTRAASNRSSRSAEVTALGASPCRDVA